MLGNWVRQTTTSTGTGDLTLASVSGYPTFDNVFGNGANAPVFFYSILRNSDGKPLEAGVGRMSASTTLVREKVLARYVSGTYDDTTPAAVNLGTDDTDGTWRVICTPEAGAGLVGLHEMHGDSARADDSRRILCIGFNGETNYGGLGTLAISANTLYLIPFSMRSARSVNRIYCEVTTGSAGKFARIGIYAVKANGHAGKLLIDSGALSVNAGAQLSASVTEVRMPPGSYYAALLSDGTPTMRAAPVMLEHMLGFSASIYRYVGVLGTASQTYGALPDPATAITGVQTPASSVNAPMVWLGLK